MKKIWVSFLFFWGLSASALAPLSAMDVLKRADEHRSPDGDFSFVVKATEYKDKKQQKETVYKIFSKAGRFSLIETISPARQRGRKLLMRDNALWLYLPNVHRPTRVSLQQKLTGEVSNGDLAKTNFVDDYAPKAMEKTVWKKRPAYRLSLAAKTDDVTYRSVDLYVDQKTLFPVQADFFAVSGKKLKTGIYSHFQKVLGKMRATQFVVKDALTPSRFTMLDYARFKREQLSESFFNKESIVD